MIRKRIKNEIRVRRFKSFHIASTPQIITGKRSIGFFSSIRISGMKKSNEVCFFIWFQLNNPIKNVQAIDFMQCYAVVFFTGFYWCMSIVDELVCRMCVAFALKFIYLTQITLYNVLQFNSHDISREGTCTHSLTLAFKILSERLSTICPVSILKRQTYDCSLAQSFDLLARARTHTFANGEVFFVRLIAMWTLTHVTKCG